MATEVRSSFEVEWTELPRDGMTPLVGLETYVDGRLVSASVVDPFPSFPAGGRVPQVNDGGA